MPRTHVVPRFLPSTHGLRFPNRFPPGPTIRLGPIDPRRLGVGDASMGLCGGFCIHVERAFRTDRPLPEATAPPVEGSPLFRALVRDQVRSLRFGVVPYRFWRMGLAGTEAAARQTREREWPKIQARLDGGRLAMIGLLRAPATNPFRLIGNHQVLAYGYDVDGDAISLRVYDPNWPSRDDVTVPLTDLPATQSTGEALIGVLSLD
jgi:hypothetical protein